MPAAQPHQPAVLCFSYLDPTGSAGLSADLETLRSLGCHCCPVINGLTSGDSLNAPLCSETDPAILIQQARAVLENMPVQVVKASCLASVAQIEMLHSLLRDYPQLPLLLSLPEIVEWPALAPALVELLIPHSRLLALSASQLQQLVPEGDTLQARAQCLRQDSACDLLIQDNHHFILINEFGVERQYRYSPNMSSAAANDTVTAATCAFLAHGDQLSDAIAMALSFTQKACDHAIQQGMGSPIPNRLFWSQKQ